MVDRRLPEKPRFQVMQRGLPVKLPPAAETETAPGAEPPPEEPKKKSRRIMPE